MSSRGGAKRKIISDRQKTKITKFFNQSQNADSTHRLINGPQADDDGLYADAASLPVSSQTKPASNVSEEHVTENFQIISSESQYISKPSCSESVRVPLDDASYQISLSVPQTTNESSSGLNLLNQMESFGCSISKSSPSKHETETFQTYKESMNISSLPNTLDAERAPDKDGSHPILLSVFQTEPESSCGLNSAIVNEFEIDSESCSSNLTEVAVSSDLNSTNVLQLVSSKPTFSATASSSVPSKNKIEKRNLLEDWKIVPGDPESTTDRKLNLVFDENSYWGMWCKCCTKYASELGVVTCFVKDHKNFNPPSRKRHTVNKHFDSKAHSACYFKSREPVSRDSGVHVQEELQKLSPGIQEKMINLFRTVYGMVLENRAASRFPFECTIQELNGANLGKTYRNSFSFNTFMHFIDADLKSKLATEINNSNAFAIMTDASTSRSGAEYEAVCVRFILVENEKSPEIKVQFLGLGEIELSADASGLFKSISEVINSAGVENWEEKLVCCTVDGASVNIGHKGGLIKKMNMTSHITCYNHVFDLCVKETINSSKFISGAISIVRALCTFYRSSPKLIRELKNIAEALKVELISFKPICETRWADSLAGSVEPVIRNYAAICSHLEEITSPFSGNNHKNEIKSTANGLLLSLTSFSTIYSLFVLCDFLEIASETSMRLESRNILLNTAMSTLKNSALSISKMNDQSKCPKLSAFLQECEEVDECEWKFKGQTLKVVIKRSMIEKKSPWEQAQEFFSSFCEKLNKRLKASADSSKTLLTIFEMMDASFMPNDEVELSEYGNDNIREFSEMFDIESSSAVAEWQELKTVIISHFTGKTDFIRLRKMLCSDSLFHMHGMKKILDILLCIPSSNADVERVWSDMKDIIGMKSVSLKKETLESRLRIKRNGCKIEQKDFCDSVNMWWKSSIESGRIRRQDF